MGEFKKRIQFYRKQTQLTRNNLKISNKEREFAYGILNGFKADVEEARKEKPTMRQIQAELIQKFPKQLFTEKQFLTEYYERNEQWVVKWFGDE